MSQRIGRIEMTQEEGFVCSIGENSNKTDYFPFAGDGFGDIDRNSRDYKPMSLD